MAQHGIRSVAAAAEAWGVQLFEVAKPMDTEIMHNETAMQIAATTGYRSIWIQHGTGPMLADDAQIEEEEARAPYRHDMPNVRDRLTAVQRHLGLNTQFELADAGGPQTNPARSYVDH